MSRKYLKFVGDRKQLKPLGFEFFRYYAMNYIGYHLNHPKRKTIQECMMWIANPCDCMFGDYDTFTSARIYEYIVGGKQEFKVIHNAVPKLYNAWESHEFVIEHETNNLVPLNQSIHEAFAVILQRKRDGFPVDNVYEELESKYRVVKIPHDLYQRLEALISHNLFTVEIFPKQN